MKKILMLGTSAVMAAAMAAPALAQDEDVITVTATKREQTLQEVPVAVSVVDDEVIEQAQINDILDLQSVVPSLRVSQLERSGNTTFIIRGFGNGANNIGIEPSVGVFIDGVYRSRSASSIADLPDLQRVEVLRGPQSTLFGKNASAGVISFVTAEPSFDWTGSVEATIGNNQQRILKGYVSGPTSDNTAFSLSGSMHKREGYVENLFNGADLNNRDRYALRGQYLIEANDDLKVRLIADYDSIDEECCYTANLLDGPTGNAVRAIGGMIAAEAPFNYETYLDIVPTNEIENRGVSGHVDWNLGFADFVSITSLRDQSIVSNGDVDFTSQRIIGSNLNDSSIETFTQEFRLTSNGGEKLDWMVGAFYFDETVDQKSNVLFGEAFRMYGDVLALSLGQAGALDQLEAALSLPNGTFFASGTGSRDSFKQENDSYSIFGQVDYEVTDRLTATVGLAYTEDNKKVSGGTVNTDAFSQVDLTAVGQGLVYQGVYAQAYPQVFAQAFFDNTTLAPTQTNYDFVANNNPAGYALIEAGAMAFTDNLASTTAAAASTVECTSTSPAGSCNPLLTLVPFQFLPPVVGFPNSVEGGKTNDDNVTYTLRLAYDLQPNVNVYGSVATGFKASSWNLSRDTKPFARDIAAIRAANLGVPNLSPGTRYAGPEYSTVYELGLKANFDRGLVNVAIFDQTIEGFQTVIFTGTGFGLANAGEQSAKGIEVDAVYEPTDELTLSFSGLLLDPVYDSFLAANGVDSNGEQAVVDLSGEQPAGIHTTSLFFSALYEKPLQNGMNMFVRGDYQYEDDVQVVDNVPASVASREVSLFNASAGLSWENGVEAFVWGRNLTDDEYLQSAFPTTAQNGSYSGYPNQPKSYGVTIRKRW